jgi:hypothetical protein
VNVKTYKVRKLTMRKHNGSDAYSWAVFEKGNPTPIVTGCSRGEARTEKANLEQQYAEKDAR